MEKSINEFFLKLQFFIFSLFILGTLANYPYEIIGQGTDWKIVVAPFWGYAINFYFPIALIFLILHLLILKVERLQLYLFYTIWLKHVFKTFKDFSLNSSKESIRKFSNWMLKTFFNDYYDSLILHSWAPPSHIDTYPTWVQKMSYENKPAFIRREHLMAKEFWPNWAFSIVVLFNELKITRSQNNNKYRFRLEVDLRYQSYGIYNNAGKLFMRDKFLGGEEKNIIYIEKSKVIENFLKGTTQKSELIINAIDTPLRWASGGVLPIAFWRGEYWYVLFFRGSGSPVGWNVANGASETKEEYKDLPILMVREFSEELILLNREPKINDPSPLVQKSFRYPFFDYFPEDFKDNLRSKKFIEKHNDLRKIHDNLTISHTDGPKIYQIETPFEIKITNHSKNLQEDFTKNFEDIIFSINPLEFGIESISLYNFNMDDNDYIIYGETWEVANCLLREPVLLLSCEYVQEVFENNGGTLGEHSMKPPYLDCKSIERIPKDKYHIFDKDIEFRKQRIEQIAKKEIHTEEIKRELELHQRWLVTYENIFKNIREENVIDKNKHLPASMLCPVTWKTLELICNYNILKNLPYKRFLHR